MIATAAPFLFSAGFVAAVYLASRGPSLDPHRHRRKGRGRGRSKRRISRATGNRLIAVAIGLTTYGPAKP